MPTTGERFERTVALMSQLRGPGGCPWDREQTFDSIKPYTVEETYEVLEAIDNRDWNELPAELGDLLLQVLFYSQMASEEGTFSIDDVLDRLAKKLVDRHPHVFGDVSAETSSEVLRNWEAIKRREKAAKPSNGALGGSLLDAVSKTMPALIEAQKLGAAAAKVGFDWPELGGLFDKLQEEVKELRYEVDQDAPDRIEAEIGDLFFVLVNLARHLSIDPGSALKKANRKFRKRFGWMEQQLGSEGKTPDQLELSELESLWQQAKQTENSDLEPHT